MSIEIKFRFELYQAVVTPLSNGIITMLGVDDGGNQYFVNNSEQGVADRWWPESQLRLV